MFVEGSGYEAGGGAVGFHGCGMKGGMGDKGRSDEKSGRMK